MADHGPSIKAPRVYEALRRKGYSKQKAARISNAHANRTLDRGGRRGGGRVKAATRSRAGRGSRRGTASAKLGRTTRGKGGRRR